MAGRKQSTAKGSASKAKSGAKSSAAKNTRSSGSKSNTKSRASSAKGKSTSSKQSAPSVEQLRQRNQTEAILWFGAAILTACFVLIPGGSVWLMVHNVLRGVFGGWAILLAVLMGYIAVSKTMEQTTMLRGGRLALMVVIVVLFCTAGHVFGSFFPKEKSFFKLVGILYMHGVEQGGAGLVGGLVGELLVKCAEVLGARIITGVLLFVSHDRYFIEKFAERIWLLEDGKIRDFPCGYQKYRSILEHEAAAKPAVSAAPKPKKERAKGGTKDADKLVRRLEREIEKQEQVVADFDRKIEAASADYQELTRLLGEKEEAEAALMDLMEQWEQVQT